MRAWIVRCLMHATAGFASTLILVAIPGPAFTGDQPIPSEEQKQTDQDRCKFLMENINATVLSLNTEDHIQAAAHMACPISRIQNSIVSVNLSEAVISRHQRKPGATKA